MQTLVQAINEALLLRSVSGISAVELAQVVTDYEQKEREIFAAAGTDRAAVDLMIQQKISVNLAEQSAKLRSAIVEYVFASRVNVPAGRVQRAWDELCKIADN